MMMLILAALAQPNRTLPASAHTYVAYVDRVVDGDTVVLDIELGWGLWLLDQPVRLRNCWAPEMKEDKGPAAKASLEAILDNDHEADGFQPGAAVTLRSGTAKSLGEREKYGRILGDVLLDGVSVGGEQIRRGHATRTPEVSAVGPTT